MKIAVVGFADPSAGDDTIAIQVISHLDKAGLPAEVIVVNGGNDALRALEGVAAMDGLVLVDAATMGEPPGTARTFTLNDLVFRNSPAPIILQGIKMDAGVLVAQKFLDLPPIRIVCIEPDSPGDERTSELLRAGIPGYVEEVKRAIRHLAREALQ